MRKIHIEENLIKDAIKKFNKKRDICEDLQISIGVLNKHLNLYNISFKRYNHNRDSGLTKRIRPDIDKKWFEDNWLSSDKSLRDLANIENVSLAILENRAIKYGLKKQLKYSFDKDRLYNLEDPTTCYLAGLIATDGYINAKVHSVEISLTGESELELLQDIKDYYKLSAPIQKYGKSYRLRLSDNKIVDFYEKQFNIPKKNKTYFLKTPDNFLSEECAKAYVKGCFDGDGSISDKNYSYRLSTASEDFIRGLAAIIEQYTNVKPSIYFEKRKDKKYPTIANGGNPAKIVLDWVYSSKTLCLKRKLKKYLKVNDIV